MSITWRLLMEKLDKQYQDKLEEYNKLQVEMYKHKHEIEKLISKMELIAADLRLMRELKK